MHFLLTVNCCGKEHLACDAWICVTPQGFAETRERVNKDSFWVSHYGAWSWSRLWFWTRALTLLEFSAVGDADSLSGSSRARAERLQLPHHIQPVFNAAEHHVPPVQPGKHTLVIIIIIIIITFTGNHSWNIGVNSESFERKTLLWIHKRFVNVRFDR